VVGFFDDRDESTGSVTGTFMTGHKTITFSWITLCCGVSKAMHYAYAGSPLTLFMPAFREKIK
jgi:apolipoprotein N-acyltransferase